MLWYALVLLLTIPPDAELLPVWGVRQLLRQVGWPGGLPHSQDKAGGRGGGDPHRPWEGGQATYLDLPDGRRGIRELVADVQAFCDAVRTTVRFCAASPQVWWISIVEGIYASVLFASVSRYHSSDHFCWNSYFCNLQTKEMESLR